MTSRTVLQSMAVIMLFSSIALAQDNETRGADRPSEQRQEDRRGPGGLGGLGLTPEQAERIRRINRERRPALEAAVRRIREATRLVDEAVYGETVDETAVNARTSELQGAQAEMTRLRTLLEFEIRKVLTPEQLNTFRRMRQRRNGGPEGRPGLRRENIPPRTRPNRRDGLTNRPPRQV